MSGGIDSTTLCYKVLNDGFAIHPLTFIYGQKHSKEIEYARVNCNKLGIEPKVVDLSSLQDLLQGSALTDNEVNIPEVPATTDHYETLKATIVPNRNAIFLAIAVGYAESIGSNSIFYGAHFSDRGVYPDCRKEFVEAFQDAERVANDNMNLVIEAPFVTMDKSEIVKVGNELGVDFSQTWSCYVGGDKHCGSCSSCRERKRAFKDSGIKDSTVYINES